MPFGPGTKADLDDQFVARQRGRQHAFSEIAHLQNAGSSGTVNLNFSVESDRYRGKFRGRIEMREATAQSAAVAGLAMPDVTDRFGKQRQALRYERAGFDVALPRHGANSDAALLFPDVGKARNPVQVDQMIRRGQPEIEHRHQRLSARERARVGLRGKQFQRLRQRCRRVVDERRRLQVRSC
jgi:hypothetical protein